MKIQASLSILASLILGASAKRKTALYGACVNATDATDYACHFDSSSCLEGEEWKTPMETKDADIKCTCDDQYTDNVHTTTCYDMTGSHTVSCAADATQCPVGSGSIGGRYNEGREVGDGCGHGDVHYGAFVGPSCGKNCLCSYHYGQRQEDGKIRAGSTNYGICSSGAQTYCAVGADSCTDPETFVGPYDPDITQTCTCKNTRTGACTADGKVTHCAVAADSCASGETFMKVTALMASDMDTNCFLCQHVPTTCHNNRKFRNKGKKNQNCAWVGKKPFRQTNLCKQTWIRNSCPTTCGVCCADDPAPAIFKQKGKKKGCKYLNPLFPNRAEKHCVKPIVASSCPVACGTCVDTSELDNEAP